MNRTLILLIAVILLGGAAWWVSTAGASPAKVSDRAPERQFGIAEIDQVHRIFIADRKGHKVNLTRGGITGWLADGKPANSNIMKNLEDAVKYLEVQSLPTPQAKPNMINNLAAQGILVQAFDKDNNKLRGYYIGGGNHDETGTFAIVEGSEEPYVVHVDHFTGNIRQRFTHWEDEWRDKVYFRIDPEKVETFSIEYPKQRDKSFVLTRKGSDFSIAPFYDTGQPVREVSRGIAEGILARYEKYYVNRYENRDEKSITEAKTLLPFAIISIKQEGMDVQEMQVYPRYVGKSFYHEAKTGALRENSGLEAYTAFINGGEDWVLLNVETLEPLMAGYSSF